MRAQGKPTYEANVEEKEIGAEPEEEKDSVYDLAVEYIVNSGKASTSMIQRKFRIGYNRAARLIDRMEEEGIIGPAEGSKARKVYRAQ